MSGAETYVLVHGAWHGGWAWNAVASHLRARGHRVFSPTMPGLGSDDDPRGVTLTDAVTYLSDFFERHDILGATLVAHSWGGFVTCGAAPILATRIRRMVFWSAFVPDKGESFLDTLHPASREQFEAQAARSADHTAALPYSAWSSAFLQDADKETQRIIYGLLRPQPFATLEEPAANNRVVLDVPTAFILADQDLAMPPGEWGWQRFAKRLAHPTIVQLEGSHESCFTRPQDVAHAVIAATTNNELIEDTAK